MTGGKHTHLVSTRLPPRVGTSCEARRSPPLAAGMRPAMSSCGGRRLRDRPSGHERVFQKDQLSGSLSGARRADFSPPSGLLQPFGVTRVCRRERIWRRHRCPGSAGHDGQQRHLSRRRPLPSDRSFTGPFAGGSRDPSSCRWHRSVWSSGRTRRPRPGLCSSGCCAALA
jgi:hypothetical protein